ncbi:MAG: hypothetical protein JRG73_11060 [Deltaproteobacteria bacterium]|nr:hypothetical protein [Deltaproteobacteria bacterium]
MEKISDEVMKEVLKRDDREEYTLIIDPAIIESDKRKAKMMYCGVKGYRPVFTSTRRFQFTELQLFLVN